MSFVNPPLAADAERQLDIRIDHFIAMNLLSTRSVTEDTDTQTTRRHTYVGFLWLRTLPVAADNANRGFEVFVQYTPVTLNVVPYLDNAAFSTAGDTNCTVTPQVGRAARGGTFLLPRGGA